MRQQLIVTAFAILAAISFWGCNAGSDIVSTREGSCNDLVEVGSERIADIIVSSPSLNFRYQTVGTKSFPRSLSIMNKGTQPVTIERVLTNCVQFLLETAESLPIVLQSNLATKFSISFKPEEAVEFDPEASPNLTGQLLVYFSGISDPVVVLLTGTGLEEDGILNIEPLAVDFGKLKVGQISGRIPILLWNGGTIPNTISGVSAVAPFRVFGFFEMTELQPATALELGVEFEPNAAGDFEQFLFIESISSGFNALIGIPLRGVGTE